MAGDAALALQQAVIARLLADADVTALVGARIFDTARADVAFPFVSLAQISAAPSDTDALLGADTTIQFDAWSRSGGTVEAKRIVAAMWASMHRAQLTLAGGAGFTMARVTNARTFMENDHETAHGLLRVGFLTLG